MFRQRRHALVKRLWKLRKSSPTSSDRHSTDLRRGHDGLKKEGEETSASTEEKRRDVAAQSMLKRLKESQLDDLIRTIESKGSGDLRSGPCCLLPRGDVRVVGGRPLPPHVLVAQLFRWPDVQHAFELKRLPICDHKCIGDGDGDESSELYECCNPFHWSRLFKPCKNYYPVFLILVASNWLHNLSS